MSIDLCVWDKCNNNCLMCTNPGESWPAWDGGFSYDYNSIIKRLEKYKEEINKSDSIYITGGEPTLNPRFIEILKYLNENFSNQNIKLLTNARLFSYEKFAKEVLNQIDNLEIEFSLYGPNDNIHDQVTRSPGSFKQTLKGGLNILKHKKRSQSVGVRFVVNKISQKYINETLETIEDFFPTIDSRIIIFMEYEGKALQNRKLSTVTYEEVLPYLKKANKHFQESKDIRLYHFPLCVLRPDFWPFTWKTWPSDEVTFAEACKKCAFKDCCVGIHKNYIQEVGVDEFRSLEGGVDIIKNNNEFHPISSVKKPKNDD